VRVGRDHLRMPDRDTRDVVHSAARRPSPNSATSPAPGSTAGSGGRSACQADDLAVRDIGADLALAPVDELLDLRHERAGQPRPGRLRQRVPARLPDRHVPGDRLRIAPGQLRSRPGRSREVKRPGNLR
jgi:hypothetical protein